MRSKWLDRDLIVGPYFTLCTTEKQFRRELKRLKVEPMKFINAGADATTHHLISPDGRQCSIVCMPHDKAATRPQRYGLLVHEAVHIWQWFVDSIGETSPSHEFEAYSIQSISQRLIDEYDRQTA